MRPVIDAAGLAPDKLPRGMSQKRDSIQAIGQVLSMNAAAGDKTYPSFFLTGRSHAGCFSSVPSGVRKDIPAAIG